MNQNNTLINTSKGDYNLKMLKNFNYEKQFREKINGNKYPVYICREPGCNHEFLRSGALLDHVYMHSGVKPYS